MSSSLKRITAEAAGSGLLVAAGMLVMSQGAITGGSGLDVTGIALTIGLTLMALMVIFRVMGGGHFNPAITFGAVLTGRETAQDGISRVIAQVAGAAIAGGILLGLFGTDAIVTSVPTLGMGVGVGTAILIEGVATFGLVMLWLRAEHRGELGALLIGLGMTVGILCTFALTGGMLNPIRAFGPELAVGEWTNMLVWLVGPLAGGVAAGVVDRFLLGEKSEELVTE